jgi:hypothetical protein
MKKISLILIFALFFLSCQNKKKLGKNDDINKIVEIVIAEDSSTILKESRLCIELKKINANYLLNEKINGEIFFSSKDSLAIIAQNSNPKKLKVAEIIIDNFNTTTIQEEMANREKGQQYSFYEMSIPVFSLNKQKAYLELDYSCGSLCGYGMAIYLKKVNGIWKVIEKHRTWVS